MPPGYSPQPQLQQPPAQTPPANYDFILNPGKPPRRPLLPGNSMATRIAIVLVGLLVLIILFAVVKSIVVQGPDYSGYTVVAEDQQALLHLFNNAGSGDQQNLSPGSQNLIATAKLTLASNQSQVFTYLSNNHQKINTKNLGLKISSQLDTELSNAQTAGTYDSTFQSIIKSRLSSYKADLSAAYRVDTGPKGQAMLKSLYNQAALLQSELTTGD